MKTKLFPVFASFIFWLNTSLSAQSLIDWEWKQVTNISYSDLEYKDNYIYAAGTFTASSVTLGPTTYTNAGGNDIIIYKMDTLGNVIWSQHVGSSNDESLKSICVDDSDNVLVTGSMSGTLNVGSTTLTSLGGKDMLMIKLSPIGNVLLAKQTGTTGDDEGMDITTDYLNDIYMVGSKSTDTMSFASTTNTYENAILKWTSTGTEVFMHFMRGTVTGLPATGTTNHIKYSAFDSTVVICGALMSGWSTTTNYYLCHSSNLGLSVSLTASTSWGLASASYLCKIELNGFATQLKDVVTSYMSFIYDISINPTNGDCYFAQWTHWPLSQYSGGTWEVANSTFSTISTLPISLFPFSVYYNLNCIPLKINYYNNALYGLVFRDEYVPVSCSNYYSARLNLVSNFSEMRNLDPGQFYSACVGYNESFSLGSTNTIGESCPFNCVVPNFSLNPAPDTAICSGTTTTIGFPDCYYAKGGSPPYSYSWSPSTGLSATNIPQPVVSGLSSTTTYILTITDSANNVIYDTVQVNLNTKPVITYSYTPSPFCAGDTVSINFNGAIHYYPNSYTIGNFLNNPLLVSPSKDTSFEVFGYDNYGCWGSTLVSLETYKVEAHTTTPFVCKNNNATLLASSANSYIWQPGSLVGDSVVTPISSTTIYTVTGTNAAGCTATATTSVLLSSSVLASAVNTSICAGNSVQLSATGSGYFSGNQTLPTGYCYPPGTNVGEWSASLNNFQFHDLVNNNSGVEPNGYGDYTSMPYVTVEKGSAYNFLLQRLATYGVKYAIWIDYNRNGSFADPNEQVYSSTVNTGSNFVTQGSVTIPLNATNGMTRMRVLCCSQYIPGGVQPCLSIQPPNGAGEYEDYRINIVSNQSLSNYSWTPATIPVNGGQVIASPITNTTYTVTSTDYQGCTATSTVAIQVKDSSSSYSNISACNNSLPYTWNGQNLTSAGNYTYLTTNANGCDSTAYLSFTVLPNATSTNTLSICANQTPYVWNGQNLSASGTYTFVSSGANGCDSIAYLTLTVLPNSTSNSSLSVCANQTPYVWNGQNLSASGTYSFISNGANGCDSTAYLSFTVLPNATSTNTLSICANQTPYVWNGQNLSASGTYSFISTGVNGCDSTAYLSFTVLPNNTSTNTLSICANQTPYAWNGQNLSASGTYSFVSSGANGCDSTAYLSFTVLPNASSNSSMSVCAKQTPYVWNGQNLSVSGTYSFVSSGANGCDSTAYLSFTVLPNATSNSSMSVCANQTPYVWNGQNLSASGTYSFISSGANGCDSTAYLSFTVLPNASSSSSMSVCANQTPYVWNGQNLSASGTYSFVSSGANGCDSTAYLTLTVLPNATSNTTLSICANQMPYVWNGQNLSASGTYSFVSNGANGCDSTAYLTLTVLPNATSTNTLSICANQIPYVWNGQNLSASGAYLFVSSGANGCDSTAYLTLTVLPNATSTNTLSICANQTPYVWNGQNLSASGTYSFVSSGANGCDSTAYLTLTVLPNATSTSSQSVCANQTPYVWNGQNLSASGTYSFVSSGANGCDSTAYLTLTVLPNATSTNTLSICANQTPYLWNGQNLSVSGTYSFISSGANGCDSTAYLALTVLPNTASTNALSICANQTPYVWNGQNLSASGTYSFVSGGVNGCDSTAYLSFTVLPNTASTNTLSICANQTPYSWNGQNLTSTGNYTYLTTNANGCDSSANLSLVVNPLPVPTINWNGNALATEPYQTSYQWYLNNVSISGATDSIYIATISGDYTVQVIDSNGCGNTSALFQFYGYLGSKDGSVTAYPNPTNSLLYINFPEQQIYHLILSDMNGRTILEKVTEDTVWFETMNLRQLDNGLYVLKIQGGIETQTIKIWKF